MGRRVRLSGKRSVVDIREDKEGEGKYPWRK